MRSSLRLGAAAVAVGLMALVAFAAGGHKPCGDDAGGSSSLSSTAKDAIPPAMARIYEAQAKRWHINVAFLASIGAQESDHGRDASAKTVNGSGCIGIMQLGVGGACGDFWGTYKCDGDHDGKMDVTNPADNVCASAKGLRTGKGAPRDGGSEKGYYRAACGYYGACSDGSANYAPQVMARAKRYGFKSGSKRTQLVSVSADADADATALGDTCGGDSSPAGPANLQAAQRVTSPRKMVELPASVTAKGYRSPAVPNGRARVDARIAPNIEWIAQRYDLRVHDCLASGHNTHGSGESCDLVPADDPLPRPGRMTPGWKNVDRLARDLGWHRPGRGYPGGYACNSGTFVPAVAIVCYDGDADHGDPEHITGGCACPHIHITWKNPQMSAPTALTTPPAWVMRFPQGNRDSAATGTQLGAGPGDLHGRTATRLTSLGS